MAQVNKYTDRAAYVADEKRLSTKSAISYIESESATVYDGVNIVVDKPAAAIGDLAVYDRTDGVIKFIKGATIVQEQIPESLVPVAVVYARQGERVLIASLDSTSFEGSTIVRWAYPYEVALSGFNLAAGGTFVLRMYTDDDLVDTTYAYPAGATLADIVAIIAATLPNYNKADHGGWTASVADDAIIMTSNTYAAPRAVIDVVSGCAIRRTSEDKNYQTTLTGVLIEGTAEYIRRKNGVNTTFAGGNPGKFIECYSANGSTKTGQKPGSGEVIRESVFTEADNPELVAAYPTYRDYLLGEHMMQYPCAYGPLLREGKGNTAKIGGKRFVNIHGETVPCYPAAAVALGYGIMVDGSTTGLEAGAWWLPSVDEVYLLMRDRVLYSADRENDPINRTLSRLGKATCYGSDYVTWTSCEHDSGGAYLYSGYAGSMAYDCRCVAFGARPVSAL